MIEESHTDRQSTLLVRHEAPILDPSWTVEDLDLEDLVLAYMGQAAASTRRRARQDHQRPRDQVGHRPVIAFSWRQFRPQAIVGITGLVVIAIVLAITGPNLVHVYDVNLAACKASGGQGPACNNPVVGTLHALQVALIALVLVVPALIGMFWGAPLIAHELETGTFRLAWTQSVSRRRWLWVKMGVVGLASALTAGLLGLMSTWWFSPIDKVSQNRFSAASFSLHGFVPGGYAAFAFALGVAAGLVFRRTLPAMAVTLVGFVVARLAVTYWVRPHFMSPATLNVPLSVNDVGFQVAGPGATSPVSMVANPPDLPNAWVTSAAVVNHAGRAPSKPAVTNACPNLGAGVGPPVSKGQGPLGGHAFGVRVSQQAHQTFNQCVSTLATRYHVAVIYQPANRFWTFQAMETALFVLLAAVLAVACVWWVRHRLS